MKETSEFPCLECNAHENLKEDFRMSNKLNSDQHNSILVSIDKVAGNIKWMRAIGSWVLATMLGYYIIIGYYIFSNDYANMEDIRVVQMEIKEGEILHYSNENNIAGINAKLEILVDHIKKDNK